MTVTHQLADGGSIVRDRIPSTDVVRVRFAEVDGLKAVAIATILAYQTMRFVGLPPGTPAAVLRLCDDASQGLTLFLVISGFALAYPALAALGSDGAAYLDIARYALKRIVRIYPAYLVVLALTAGLHPLALLFDLNSVANATPVFDSASFARAAVFGGDPGNDGLVAVALVARGYVILPLLLALWVRTPGGAIALAVAAALLDLFTAAHGFGLGIALPLVLGIAVADVRARRPHLERFGFPIAIASATVAWIVGPHLQSLPGPAAAPGMLRVDPFWSVAAAGVLAGIGAARPLERLMALGPLRLLGAASYAISLVAMPIAAFAARHVTPRLGSLGIILVTIGAAVAAGFVLWQGVDRWFGDDRLRRRAAEMLGPSLEAFLTRLRLARIVFGRAPIAQHGEFHLVAVSPQKFYTPPPRSAPAEVAVLSTRSGSADELAAEILEAKRRLGERSAVVLARESETLQDDDVPGIRRRASDAPARETPVPPTASVTPVSVESPARCDPPVPNRFERSAIHLRITPDRRKDDA